MGVGSEVWGLRSGIGRASYMRLRRFSVLCTMRFPSQWASSRPIVYPSACTPPETANDMRSGEIFGTKGSAAWQCVMGSGRRVESLELRGAVPPLQTQWAAEFLQAGRLGYGSGLQVVRHLRRGQRSEARGHEVPVPRRCGQIPGDVPSSFQEVYNQRKRLCRRFLFLCFLPGWHRRIYAL